MAGVVGRYVDSGTNDTRTVNTTGCTTLYWN